MRSLSRPLGDCALPAPDHPQAPVDHLEQRLGSRRGPFCLPETAASFGWQGDWVLEVKLSTGEKKCRTSCRTVSSAPAQRIAQGFFAHGPRGAPGGPVVGEVTDIGHSK